MRPQSLHLVPIALGRLTGPALERTDEGTRLGKPQVVGQVRHRGLIVEQLAEVIADAEPLAVGLTAVRLPAHFSREFVELNHIFVFSFKFMDL